MLKTSGRKREAGTIAAVIMKMGIMTIVLTIVMTIVTMRRIVTNVRL